MKGKISCCGCGTVFSAKGWSEAGVLRLSVNGGKNHYGCKTCRERDPQWMFKHAAMLTGLCAEPKPVTKG
jgi:hypothetical protein